MSTASQPMQSVQILSAQLKAVPPMISVGEIGSQIAAGPASRMLTSLASLSAPASAVGQVRSTEPQSILMAPRSVNKAPAMSSQNQLSANTVEANPSSSYQLLASKTAANVGQNVGVVREVPASTVISSSAFRSLSLPVSVMSGTVRPSVMAASQNQNASTSISRAQSPCSPDLDSDNTVFVESSSVTEVKRKSKKRAQRTKVAPRAKSMKATAKSKKAATNDSQMVDPVGSFGITVHAQKTSPVAKTLATVGVPLSSAAATATAAATPPPPAATPAAAAEAKPPATPLSAAATDPHKSKQALLTLVSQQTSAGISATQQKTSLPRHVSNQHVLIPIQGPITSQQHPHQLQKPLIIMLQQTQPDGSILQTAQKLILSAGSVGHSTAVQRPAPLVLGSVVGSGQSIAGATASVAGDKMNIGLPAATPFVLQHTGDAPHRFVLLSKPVGDVVDQNSSAAQVSKVAEAPVMVSSNAAQRKPDLQPVISAAVSKAPAILIPSSQAHRHVFVTSSLASVPQTVLPLPVCANPVASNSSVHIGKTSAVVQVSQTPVLNAAVTPKAKVQKNKGKAKKKAKVINDSNATMEIGQSVEAHAGQAKAAMVISGATLPHRAGVSSVPSAAQLPSQTANPTSSHAAIISASIGDAPTVSSGPKLMPGPKVGTVLNTNVNTCNHHPADGNMSVASGNQASVLQTVAMADPLSVSSTPSMLLLRNGPTLLLTSLPMTAAASVVAPTTQQRSENPLPAKVSPSTGSAPSHTQIQPLVPSITKPGSASTVPVMLLPSPGVSGRGSTQSLVASLAQPRSASNLLVTAVSSPVVLSGSSGQRKTQPLVSTFAPTLKNAPTVVLAAVSADDSSKSNAQTRTEGGRTEPSTLLSSESVDTYRPTKGDVLLLKENTINTKRTQIPVVLHDPFPVIRIPDNGRPSLAEPGIVLAHPPVKSPPVLNTAVPIPVPTIASVIVSQQPVKSQTPLQAMPSFQQTTPTNVQTQPTSQTGSVTLQDKPQGKPRLPCPPRKSLTVSELIRIKKALAAADGADPQQTGVAADSPAKTNSTRQVLAFPPQETISSQCKDNASATSAATSVVCQSLAMNKKFPQTDSQLTTGNTASLRLQAMSPMTDLTIPATKTTVLISAQGFSSLGKVTVQHPEPNQNVISLGTLPHKSPILPTTGNALLPDTSPHLKATTVPAQTPSLYSTTVHSQSTGFPIVLQMAPLSTKTTPVFVETMSTPGHVCVPTMPTPSQTLPTPSQTLPTFVQSCPGTATPRLSTGASLSASPSGQTLPISSSHSPLLPQTIPHSSAVDPVPSLTFPQATVVSLQPPPVSSQGLQQFKALPSSLQSSSLSHAVISQSSIHSGSQTMSVSSVATPTVAKDILPSSQISYLVPQAMPCAVRAKSLPSTTTSADLSVVSQTRPMTSLATALPSQKTPVSPQVTPILQSTPFSLQQATPSLSQALPSGFPVRVTPVIDSQKQMMCMTSPMNLQQLQVLLSNLKLPIGSIITEISRGSEPPSASLTVNVTAPITSSTAVNTVTAVPLGGGTLSCAVRKESAGSTTTISDAQLQQKLLSRTFQTAASDASETATVNSSELVEVRPSHTSIANTTFVSPMAPVTGGVPVTISVPTTVLRSTVASAMLPTAGINSRAQTYVMTSVELPVLAPSNTLSTIQHSVVNTGKQPILASLDTTHAGVTHTQNIAAGSMLPLGDSSALKHPVVTEASSSHPAMTSQRTNTVTSAPTKTEVGHALTRQDETIQDASIPPRRGRVDVPKVPANDTTSMVSNAGDMAVPTYTASCLSQTAMAIPNKVSTRMSRIDDIVMSQIAFSSAPSEPVKQAAQRRTQKKTQRRTSKKTSADSSKERKPTTPLVSKSSADVGVGTEKPAMVFNTEANLQSDSLSTEPSHSIQKLHHGIPEEPNAPLRQPKPVAQTSPSALHHCGDTLQIRMTDPQSFRPVTSFVSEVFRTSLDSSTRHHAVSSATDVTSSGGSRRVSSSAQTVTPVVRPTSVDSGSSAPATLGSGPKLKQVFSQHFIKHPQSNVWDTKQFSRSAKHGTDHFTSFPPHPECFAQTGHKQHSSGGQPPPSQADHQANVFHSQTAQDKPVRMGPKQSRPAHAGPYYHHTQTQSSQNQPPPMAFDQQNPLRQGLNQNETGPNKLAHTSPETLAQTLNHSHVQHLSNETQPGERQALSNKPSPSVWQSQLQGDTSPLCQTPVQTFSSHTDFRCVGFRDTVRTTLQNTDHQMHRPVNQSFSGNSDLFTTTDPNAQNDGGRRPPWLSPTNIAHSHENIGRNRLPENLEAISPQIVTQSESSERRHTETYLPVEASSETEITTGTLPFSTHRHASKQTEDPITAISHATPTSQNFGLVEATVNSISYAIDNTPQLSLFEAGRQRHGSDLNSADNNLSGAAEKDRPYQDRERQEFVFSERERPSLTVERSQLPQYKEIPLFVLRGDQQLFGTEDRMRHCSGSKERNPSGGAKDSERERHYADTMQRQRQILEARERDRGFSSIALTRERQFSGNATTTRERPLSGLRDRHFSGIGSNRERQFPGTRERQLSGARDRERPLSGARERHFSGTRERHFSDRDGHLFLSTPVFDRLMTISPAFSAHFDFDDFSGSLIPFLSTSTRSRNSSGASSIEPSIMDPGLLQYDLMQMMAQQVGPALTATEVVDNSAPSGHNLNQ